MVQLPDVYWQFVATSFGRNLATVEELSHVETFSHDNTRLFNTFQEFSNASRDHQKQLFKVSLFFQKLEQSRDP